ncbi:hydroxyacylglutathione hydrolase [Roseofilum casamattae]|uniref:Hydroxyacylglutathione hydrolase n=1 Tax=Roseofilum casamattae BLCC-M143 TaxID=3022442 RepID=A0ABT7BS53_9CYAN|nr:hydroxyacylglutathione hydrolase [Roseofilum casamattae]MDJ1182023.1 hydroxyacylglutathione hydrolase [Roseofilum casamattae BLCC-M143]
MQVYRLPAFSDNYIFVLHDRHRHEAAVVDPGDAGPVLECLDRLGATLTSILNTHHHNDHIGGNRELIQTFPHLCVYGGSRDRGRIPGQQFFLEDGDRLHVLGREVRVFFVPGHTRAHVAYYVPPQTPNEPGDLFCGDTLFAGGCGRLSEGTPGQMLDSLHKLRNLPDSTRIWCAHEYTLNNLKFALTVDGNNTKLQQRLTAVKRARAGDRPTIPSVLAEEKLTNPFLRWDDPHIQAAVGSTDPIQTFRRLRGKKDLF